MRRISHLLSIAVVALSLAACVSGPPRDTPDIRGSVTSFQRTDDGASMLVEGRVEGGTSFDKASVTVRDDTEVWRREGDKWRRGEIGDLARAKRVEAWFTGPVAESYPVQATARAIAVLE